jgi:tetratricopeptide (TPR) repeat protein
LRRAGEGNTLVAQGKFEQGIPALKAALESDKGGMSVERLAVCNNLAGAYTATGKTAEAQKLLEDARKQVEALPETVIAKKEYRTERVRMLTGIANVLLAQGKLPEAESLYRKAVLLGPEDAAAHSNLANVLSLQQKYAEADAHFDMAAARQPDNPETLCNWGIMLLNYKRPLDAEAKFRKALMLNSRAAKYYHGLGLALRAQTRFGPALQAQRTALHFDPKMVDAILEIADIDVQLKEYHDAEIYLRAAISKEGDPKNVQAIQALARLLLGTPDPQQKNVLEAAELFQRAVDLTKAQDVNLLTQLADSLALAEVFDRARETIEVAITRAREQNLSPVDMEALLQHRQQYALMEQAKNEKDLNAGVKPVTRVKTEFTTVGEPFGMQEKVADPYDTPKKPPLKFNPTEIVAPP